MNRAASLLLIGALNVLIIKLYINDDLTLYIHPRYLMFTLIMNILSILLVAIALWIYLKNNALLHKNSFRKPKILALLTALVILAGLYIPPVPLLSSSVSQRVDATEMVSTDCTEIDSSKPPKSFQEWHTLITTCNEPELYRDQPITLEGFVYKDPVTKQFEKEGVFMIARFKVSCCAVDAFPLLLPIEESNKYKDLASDQWIRVRGKLKPKKFIDGSKIVVSIESLDKIAQPENPYEFISY